MSSSKAGQLNGVHYHNLSRYILQTREKECLFNVYIEYRQLGQALNDDLGRILFNVS